MLTILWIFAMALAAMIGFIAAIIMAGSGQASRYEEGVEDGRMIEQLWLQGKLKEKLNEDGYVPVEEFSVLKTNKG